MSTQLALDGKTKVDLAIDRLRQFCPPEGYWLAFSGGKDSVCLLELAKRAGVKFDAYYNVCPDPPELIRFVRAFPEVQWSRGRASFYAMMVYRGFPTRRQRWCCDEFKESSGKGRVVVTGIRTRKGRARRHRQVVENCRRHPSRVLVAPILDWTDEDVWGFIRGEGLRYCSLYDEGFKRLGCVPCPFERNVQRSMARWPGIWRLCRKAFDPMYIEGPPSVRERFPSAEAAWQWWIARDTPYPRETDQLCLFGDGGQGWSSEMHSASCEACQPALLPADKPRGGGNIGGPSR